MSAVLPEGHPFAGLLSGGYRVIYCDPPTKFSAGPQKNPSNHYPTMRLKDIAALPVRDLAHPDGCRLFLWTTPPLLLHPHGPMAMLKAWGFSYSTVRTWQKLRRTETGLFIYNNSQNRGSGYETTGDAEFLIIGKRGKPQSLRHVGKPRGLVAYPLREHSRKPDEIRDELASLFEGPRVELFTRQRFEGWDSFGNEMDKFGG